MEFALQINRYGELTPYTRLIDITEKKIALMPVSECYRLMEFIALEWNLNLLKEKDFKITYKMLIYFAKYN